MKTQTSPLGLFASLGAASLVALTAAAQTPAPTRLPYGVEDVLNLTRAQVSEEITLNYIRNSGTIYNLAPKDIVYLRNEGVSDNVINTMLDQRKNVPAEAAANPTTSPPVTQYVPTYTQPAPPPAPASTLYVIPYPYPGGGGYYPYYSPYYYGNGYYRYGAPSTVFSIGYRGSGYCGAYPPRYSPRGAYRFHARR